MKRALPLLIVLLILSTLLAGCLDPIALLSNSDPVSTPPARVTAVPGPTRSANGGPLDLSGLIRTSVTQADQTNEQAIESAEIPVADLRELAIRFKDVPADVPLKNCTTPPLYNVGAVEKFNVQNGTTLENFTIEATLIAKSDNAYMWLDNQWLNQVDHDALRKSAQTFSNKIVPRNRALFGQEDPSGIDCDPRIHILNTSNTDAGGYFSSIDGVTRQVRDDSNEKDMFYIDIEGVGGPEAIGSSYYNGVLAHEFQHLILNQQDQNEDSWISEGMSELAIYLNGDDPGADFIAALNPNTQLNSWPENGATTPEGHNSYGTAFSFMLYFWDRYGDAGVQALAAADANGLAGLQQVLDQIDPGKTADDLVADWLVARLLDSPNLDEGRYGYQQTDRPRVEPRQTIAGYPFSDQGSVNQYAGDYTEFTGGRDITIDFAGSTKAQMIGAQPHSGDYFLWSNRADVADLRAQHEFDLSNVKEATLQYWTWYDLEADWDYAYASISEDGGKTWQLLKAPSMTDSDPTNANFGWGYTDKSGGGDRAEWIQERIDLTPYAGKKIIVAFDVINDLAVNRPALALDDVEVPEIGYRSDFEKDDGGWQLAGWLRTNNFVPQRYVAQLISFGKDGQTTVTRLPLKDDNTAQWDVPLSQLKKAIVVISPMAARTTEEALYSWSAKEK